MVVEWTAFLGPLLALGANIITYAGQAQRYRKKCQLLLGRVETINGHLGDMQMSKWTPDPPAMKNTLESLEQVLHCAEHLVISCQRKKRTFDFLRAHKMTGEFAFVDKRITDLMQNFHLANRTLILGLYGEQAFMVTLDTLIDDQAIRRLPQDKKEMLERSIAGLTYSDYMSPEKIRRLERIKGELRQGSKWRQWENAASGISGANNPAATRDRNEAADAARRIVARAEAAHHHNREEVQRVAQLAQQVLYLLPHLQSPPLARNAEAGQLVANLCNDLDGALSTIESRPLQCSSPAVMASAFWRQQAKRLSELGNRIEYALKSLQVIVVHVISGLGNAPAN